MAAQTQATGGKGKKKNKEILKVSLDEFNDINTPVGHSVVNVKVGTGLDWAATMANYDDQSADTKQIIVPSAPRAHRGPDIDFESLPDEGPFKVSLFNLPLSVEDKDINDRFFQDLKILNIEQGKQATTVELATKDDLYHALCKDGISFKGKTINVCLYGQQPQLPSYGSRGGYGERYDRYGSDGRYNDRQSNSYGNARNDRFGDRPSYNRDNAGGMSTRQGPGSYSSYNRPGGSFGDKYNDRGNFRERDNRNNYMSQGTDEAPRDEPKNWRDRPNPVPPPPQPAYNSGPRNSSYSRQDPHQQNYQQSSQQQQYRSDPHYQNRSYHNQQSNNYNHPYSSQSNPSDNSSGPASETRPKLQLKPRTTPLRQDEPSNRNSAIFGQAKPSNKPYEKILEVEEKLKSVNIKDKPATQ